MTGGTPILGNPKNLLVNSSMFSCWWTRTSFACEKTRILLLYKSIGYRNLYFPTSYTFDSPFFLGGGVSSNDASILWFLLISQPAGPSQPKPWLHQDFSGVAPESPRILCVWFIHDSWENRGLLWSTHFIVTTISRDDLLRRRTSRLGWMMMKPFAKSWVEYSLAS